MSSRKVSYPELPRYESVSESESHPASPLALNVISKRRYESERESGEDSDKELGGVLERLSVKDSVKVSDKKFDKEPRKKLKIEVSRKSDSESGKNSDRDSGKKIDKESGKSPDRNSDKKSDKEPRKKLKIEVSRKSDSESGKQSDRDSGKKIDKESSKKTGQDTDEENSHESDNDEGATEHKKATHYTREQREELTRVFKCSIKDYYGILGLEENCPASKVKKAYRNLSLMTHPDKNKFKEAGEIFKKVQTAYEVLGNPEQRKIYDRKRKAYKLRGELDSINSWDEEFAENASGTDSGSESDSDDDEEERKPDSFRMIIYKEATPWVQKLLADPDDSLAKSQIESLNKRIKKQNTKDGFKEREFYININVLRAIGMEAGIALESLAKDPKNKKARQQQEKLETQLEKTIRTNSYPQEWRDCLPWSRKRKGKKQAEAAPPKEREKGKGREKPSSSKKMDRDSDTDMPDVGPASRKGTGRERSPSSKQNDQESDLDMTDAPTRRTKWEPGETRKGEKILGWRPFYKTDRRNNEQLFNGCQFVIEKKGHPNPIALVSGDEVGRRVVDAYLDLPEENQFDVRYSEEKYTQRNAKEFDELLGFACKPFTTKTEGSGAYYPVGYALYSFTDGSTDLVSRECMRRVFGKTDADNEIADFYENIGETPPWLMKPKVLLNPKKLLTSGSEVKRRSKLRRHADSDDESDSDSDPSSLFVSAKKKGRRRVRNDESSDDDNSSGEDSGDGRGQNRMPRKKRNMKMKKAIDFNDQSDIFAGIMQKFMRQMVEENKRQAEHMSHQFEEVLSRISVL